MTALSCQYSPASAAQRSTAGTRAVRVRITRGPLEGEEGDVVGVEWRNGTPVWYRVQLAPRWATWVGRLECEAA